MKAMQHETCFFPGQKVRKRAIGNQTVYANWNSQEHISILDR